MSSVTGIKISLLLLLVCTYFIILLSQMLNIQKKVFARFHYTTFVRYVAQFCRRRYLWAMAGY